MQHALQSEPHLVQVVAAIVVDSERRVLAVRKGVTRYTYTSGRWEFPGGKVEACERPERALARELREEMGYDVTVGRLLATTIHHYPDFSIALHGYLCHPTAGSSFVLREHTEARWLTPDALGSLDWCDADIPLAQAAAKFIQLEGKDANQYSKVTEICD